MKTAETYVEEYEAEIKDTAPRRWRLAGIFLDAICDARADERVKTTADVLAQVATTMAPRFGES